MKEARAGDQVVRYDREATAAIYGGLKHGFAEECGCVFCRNFAAQRDCPIRRRSASCWNRSASMRNKEFEAFEYGPSETE